MRAKIFNFFKKILKKPQKRKAVLEKIKIKKEFKKVRAVKK